MQVQCVYCEVLNEILRIMYINFELQAPFHGSSNQSPAISRRRTGFDLGLVQVKFEADEVAFCQIFPPSTSVFPVNICPKLLLIRTHLHISTTLY